MTITWFLPAFCWNLFLIALTASRGLIVTRNKDGKKKEWFGSKCVGWSNGSYPSSVSLISSHISIMSAQSSSLPSVACSIQTPDTTIWQLLSRNAYNQWVMVTHLHSGCGNMIDLINKTHATHQSSDQSVWTKDCHSTVAVLLPWFDQFLGNNWLGECPRFLKTVDVTTMMSQFIGIRHQLLHVTNRLITGFFMLLLVPWIGLREELSWAYYSRNEVNNC